MDSALNWSGICHVSINENFIIVCIFRYWDGRSALHFSYQHSTSRLTMTKPEWSRKSIRIAWNQVTKKNHAILWKRERECVCIQTTPEFDIAWLCLRSTVQHGLLVSSRCTKINTCSVQTYKIRACSRAAFSRALRIYIDSRAKHWVGFTRRVINEAKGWDLLIYSSCGLIRLWGHLKQAEITTAECRIHINISSEKIWMRFA